MKKQFVKKIRKALAVLTGAAFICLLSGLTVTHAEGTVDLSIETKEININDIPSDRKVSIAINLDSDPDADLLKLIIQADSRLITHSMNLGVSDKYSNTFTEYRGDPFTESLVVFLNENCDNSGNVAELWFYLPDNCAPGDFYEIAFTNEVVNGFQICYGNMNTGWHYGFESFGRLNSGGIRITGDAPPAPEQPQVQNNEPAQNVQQSEAPPASENPPENSSQVQQQTENTETSEITSTVSETGSSVSVSTAESSDTIKKSVTTDELLITEYYGETESFIPEEPDHKENNNKNYLIYILIIAGAAAAAGAVIFIINKEKKKS